MALVAGLAHDERQERLESRRRPRLVVDGELRHEHEPRALHELGLAPRPLGAPCPTRDAVLSKRLPQSWSHTSHESRSATHALHLLLVHERRHVDERREDARFVDPRRPQTARPSCAALTRRGRSARFVCRARSRKSGIETPSVADRADAVSGHALPRSRDWRSREGCRAAPRPTPMARASAGSGSVGKRASVTAAAAGRGRGRRCRAGTTRRSRRCRPRRPARSHQRRSPRRASSGRSTTRATAFRR